MQVLKLIGIGIIQGITELLPISSSAHMLLLGNILNIDITSSLLILFHLGTTIAVILFLRKQLFKNFFSKKKLAFYGKILIATIPAGVIGFLFEDIISRHLRADWIIGISLIVWGIVMIVLEKKETTLTKKMKQQTVEEISLKQALAIGFSQALALIPGTSRSAITTITGILVGLPKYIALKFSFVLSIPILLGSFTLFLFQNLKERSVFLNTVGEPFWINTIVIFIITFLFGFLSLKLIEKFKKKNWLTFFGIYRILLGIIVLLSFFL